MIKYKFVLTIGCQAKQEDILTVEDMGYTDEGWLKLDDSNREFELDYIWQIWSSNFIDGGWSKIDDDGQDKKSSNS